MSPIIVILGVPIAVLICGGFVALWVMRRDQRHPEIAEHQDSYWSARR